MRSAPLLILVVWALAATAGGVWLWRDRVAVADDRDRLHQVAVLACNQAHDAVFSFRSAALYLRDHETDIARDAIRRHAQAVDAFSNIGVSCATDPQRADEAMRRVFTVAESGTAPAEEVVALADELVAVFPMRVPEDRQFRPRAVLAREKRAAQP